MAVFKLSALVAFLLALVLSPYSASAAVFNVEPDDFTIGTVIDNRFPGVTLSVDGHPASNVQVLDGFSTFNGKNIATTGTSVFGSLPVFPTPSSPQAWAEGEGLLRADFHVWATSVSIDLIFTDDDVGVLRAYNLAGDLLEEVSLSGDGRPDALPDYATAIILRPVGDIAYVTAGSPAGSGDSIFLDNLTVSIPALVQTSLVSGPWRDDGAGNLEPFDVNNDGSTTPADEGKLIGIDVPHAQYYVYQIEIVNHGPNSALDNFSFLDILPDGFRLSSFAEEACTGAECDGVAVDGNCVATVSGPKAKKNTIEPRYVIIEPSGLDALAVCTATVYVETMGGDSGKRKNSGVFYPKTCQVADTNGDETLNNTVSLNEGVKVFDTTSNDLLSGPVGSIQLAPEGCP